MPAAQPYRGTTVLIVEDHDDTRDAFRLFLEFEGAQVLEARNGREALGILRKTPPHIVFCDLRMPGMDGFEFIRQLQGDPKLCRVRVVAVTGQTSHADLVKCWEAGFDGHLSKPMDRDAIVTELDRVLWLRPAGS